MSSLRQVSTCSFSLLLVGWLLMQLCWLSNSKFSAVRTPRGGAGGMRASLRMQRSSSASCRSSLPSSSLPFFPGGSGLVNFTLPLSTNPPLGVRLIFAGKYGRTGGLWMDVAIYHDLLVSLGHKVEIVAIQETPEPSEEETCFADVQIFFERVYPEWLNPASYNMFVPNHEIKHDLSLYRKLNAVICKTQIAKRLVDTYVNNNPVFADLRVFYIGHTSWDMLKSGAMNSSGARPTQKNFSQFIHVGGKSLNKGSEVVYKTWRAHPEWPTLHLIDYKFSTKYFRKEHIMQSVSPYNFNPNSTGIMVQNNLFLHTSRLPDQELAHLQQAAGIHMCPSREEGFGHYINEARALGAVVMTTNWGPMNELVRDEFGILIPCQLTANSRYSSPFAGNRACFVKSEGLEQAMSTYFSMRDSSLADEDILGKMGVEARKQYELDHNAFKERFRQMFHQIAKYM